MPITDNLDTRIRTACTDLRTQAEAWDAKARVAEGVPDMERDCARYSAHAEGIMEAVDALEEVMQTVPIATQITQATKNKAAQWIASLEAPVCMSRPQFDLLIKQAVMGLEGQVRGVLAEVEKNSQLMAKMALPSAKIARSCYDEFAKMLKAALLPAASAESECSHVPPQEPRWYSPCPKCGYCSPDVKASRAADPPAEGEPGEVLAAVEAFQA